MTRVAEWLDFGKTVARLTYKSDIRYLATAVAYYGFVSLVPLLLIVVAVVGWRFAGDVSARSAELVTPDAQQLLSESLASASGRTGAVVLSVAVLAWGSANVATGFLTAFERLEAATDRPITLQFRDATVVLGSLSLAVLVVLFETVVLTFVPGGSLAILVGAVVLLAVLTVMFLPLYYVPSRVAGSLSTALPGALAAAFGWTLIYAGIQFYAVNAGQYAVYGVLSGIIILLTSIYLAAVVLMVGVVVNAVLATDTDDPTDVTAFRATDDEPGPLEGGE
jgi:membrane protein